MSGRMTLTFVDGVRKFNYRVAGVALRNSHVLVCREDDQDYVFLPGGRVEFGEPSDAALRREVREELGCSAEVGRLLFSVENFFELTGEHFHELAKYYVLGLPESFPFGTDGPCLVTHDEGHVLRFYWVSLETEALQDINLLPRWIRGRLADLPETSECLIRDER